MRAVDWHALRGPIVLVAFAAVIGTIMVGGAIRFHADALSGHERQKERLEAMRSRFRTIDEQRRTIETWLPAFRSLESAGVIADERRLEWLEALRAAATHPKLPSLRYRFEPRKEFRASPGLDAGAYRAFSTVVRIEAGLLHEGDLGRLVGDLVDGGTGLVRIERCDVRRTGSDFVMRPDAANLTVKCDVRWITFARPETRQ